MIPPELRDFETYIVSYSGGKDSTATLLWALENLPRERLQVVFANTTVEWPETYEYLNYIERELGITIDRVRAGDRALPPIRKGRQGWAYATSLFEMIRQRGMWPGARTRYCTTYLKVWPITLYSRGLENPVLITGQRASESKARMGLPIFSERGNKQVQEPLSTYRPILAWSERQVWDYLRTYHILPNPIYNHATRCGCWCCIMGRPAEVLNFCRLHPDIAQETADLEREIGHTWKENQSIGNLLRQAQAQMELFEREPRFAEVGG